MCDNNSKPQSIDLASWGKLQPILEKYILKNNIPGGVDKGLDILLSWFETISKSSDKINTFKSIVGLSPDMEERKVGSRLSYSTSSISDLVEKEGEFDKKRLNEDEFDFRNKRMKVSRLLCNEDINGGEKVNGSDEENSDGVDYEEENSSLESNSPNGGAADDYGGSDSEMIIDEADFAAQKGRKALEMSGNGKMGAPPKNASSAATNGLAPTPKQLMIIREKMLEYVQKNPSASRPSCIQVVQHPTTSVVWKNRRLDTPFKVKLDAKMASSMAGTPLNTSSVLALGVVTDHKGKLQIDSVENFTEAFNAQSMAAFQGLKMTKGTWGKEWSLTFIALARPANNSFTNSTVLSVSQPFPIVVKTRKNPQIRHNYSGASTMSMERHAASVISSASENSSSSPEASPTMVPRRGRLPASAPLMSLQSRGHSFPFSSTAPSTSNSPASSSATPSPSTPSNTSNNSTTNNNSSSSSSNHSTNSSEQTTSIRFPQDDMASLLWAAEIKQREHDPEPEIIQSPPTSSSSTSSISSSSTSSSSSSSTKVKYTSMIISPPKQIHTAVSTR